MEMWYKVCSELSWGKLMVLGPLSPEPLNCVSSTDSKFNFGEENVPQ